MEETVIVKNERKMSNTALFWVSVIVTVGVGLAVAYSSGIMAGMGQLIDAPYYFPDWAVIIIPPVLFLHLGLALYFTLRENVYTASGKMVRTWTWIFWITLFLVTAFTPYFVFHNMPVASYAVATIACALALGTAILMYRQSRVAGVLMTIFLLSSISTMVYLGFWAFA